MNILFVCLANMRRSRTAVEMFSEIFKEHSDLHFDSCGVVGMFVESSKLTWPQAKMCTQELIDWADRIICMDDTVTRWLMEDFQVKRLEDWAIPNIYQYNDPQLKRELMMKIWQ